MKKLIRFTFVLYVIVSMNTPGVAQHSWSVPLLIDTSRIWPTFYYGGRMALDDSGNIFTAFATSRSESIYVARSTNGGNAWNKYAYASGAESLRSPMDISVDHIGNVWLLWISTDGQDFSPYFLNLSKSVDSGRTFTLVFHAFAWQDGSFSEKLAVDNQDNIYMLWDDQQVKLTRFYQGDLIQRRDTEIPNDSLMFGSTTALVVSSDNVIHCIWVGSYFDSLHNYHEYVFYSRSNDTGLTFQGKVPIDTTPPFDSTSDVYHYPSLGVDS